MKVQHLAVIFIIIILPISMVLSYSIGTQIDTITLQTKYNAKLTDATYDAVRAFQINTVNNRYSSISNSKIRDIEASVSTFYNALSSNDTKGREDLQYYVPALVYTLYDGYYIYSKYDNVYATPENKNKFTNKWNTTQNWKPQLDQNILDGDSEQYTNFGLKPYIYYACHYKTLNKDFVVNYTLDNAITIYGTFNGMPKTLSGYLIDPNKVIIVDASNYILTYDGIQIGPEVLTEHLLFEDGTGNDYTYLEYNGQKIYYDSSKTATENETQYFFYQNYKQQYISTYNAEIIDYVSARTSEGILLSTSAYEYYKRAQDFSVEVEKLIGDVTQNDAIDSEGRKINSEESTVKFSTNTGAERIFQVAGNAQNDPLLSDSTFNENRMSVIRYSIQTNLTAAINNYNMYSDIYNYEFAMPELQEEDWEKITEKVCVMSFLQGIPIGHKYFNDYCVIPNNNNEETINKENVYIITQTTANGNREYHLPGCKYLIKENSMNDIKVGDIKESYSNISFFRQKVRITEDEFKFFYPQTRGTTVNNKNQSGFQYLTSCYHCIVNAADVYSADQIIKGELMGKDDNWEDTVEVNVTNKGKQAEREKLIRIRELYLKALARERYSLYQANMDRFMEN